MKPPELWDLTERCIAAFDGIPPASCITEDEHVRDFLQPLLHAEKITEEEMQFVREVTYGVLRHRPFLLATLQGYCDALKKNKQHARRVTMVYYVVLFRFDELGPTLVRQLVTKSLSHNRLAEILELLLDEAALRQFVVPRWIEVVEDRYVERHIIRDTINRLELPLRDLVTFFREGHTTSASRDPAATGDERARETAISDGAAADDTHHHRQIRPPPSEPSDPFLARLAQRNAAAPAATLLLPPYEVRALGGRERERFPKIVDTCTEAERRCAQHFKDGLRSASTLDAAVREANRAAEKAIPFRDFTATSRPLQLPKLLAEAERREAEAMRPVTTGMDPAAVGDMLRRVRDEVPLKMTRSALSREHQLYRSRMHAEEQSRLRKERELRDDTEYRAWKRRMDDAEEEERAAMLSQRKAELEAGDAAARMARVRRQEKNHKIIAEAKLFMDQWRREVHDDSERRRVALADRAAHLREDLHKRTTRALDAIAAAKKRLALEVRSDDQRIEQTVALELELERQRKQQLIEDIKEAHSAFVDLQRRQRATLAERVAHAAQLHVQLSSMTIAELRERLTETKAARAAWESEQRSRIQQEKNDTAAALRDQTELVERQRQVLREEREAKRLAKIDAAQAKAAAAQKREEALAIELQARLEQQRKEKSRAEKERRRMERDRRVAAQLLNADAGNVEVIKWSEMERGHRNATATAQNRNLQERKTRDAVEEGVSQTRQHNITAVEQAAFDRRRATDATFRAKRTAAAAEQAQDDEIRLSATRRMREQTRTLRLTALPVTTGM